MTEDRYKAFQHVGGQINNFNYLPGWYIERFEQPPRTMNMQTRCIIDKPGYGFQPRPWPSKAKAEAAARRETQHAVWRHIWKQAFNNMPYRICEIKKETWEPVEVGATPLPTYIEGNVKGKLKMVNNQVYHLIVTITKHKYSQRAMLARLLGYVSANAKKSEYRGKPHHNRVYTAMQGGQKPRDPAKADLLKRLAEPDGNELAWKLASEKLGAKIKRYHKVQK